MTPIGHGCHAEGVRIVRLLIPLGYTIRAAETDCQMVWIPKKQASIVLSWWFGGLIKDLEAL